MNNTQKGSATVWIVIVVVIIIALGVWYFTKPQSAIQQNSMTGWKTYTDAKGTLTFQYPQDWSVESSDSSIDLYENKGGNPAAGNKISIMSDAQNCKAHDWQANEVSSKVVCTNGYAIALYNTDEQGAVALEEKILSTIKFSK